MCQFADTSSLAFNAISDEASGIPEKRMKTVAETFEGKTLFIAGATGFLPDRIAPMVEGDLAP